MHAHFAYMCVRIHVVLHCYMRVYAVLTYQADEGDEPKDDDGRCHSDEDDRPNGETIVWSARGWEGSLDVT